MAQKAASSSSSEESIGKKEIESASSGLVPNQIRNYKKLCGYMNKYSTKGLIRTARKRWFVFCDKNCKLYYYRNSDNQMPLGEIDIGKATFYFDANNKEKPGVFTISTPRKNYTLEAKDRQACLFWMQELQHWRRIFSKSRTQQMNKSPLGEKSIQGIPNSGLLAQNAPDQSDVSEDNTEALLLAPISQPDGIIGEQTALSNAQNPIALAQQRMVQLRTQVFNSMSSMKQQNRQSDARFSSVSFNTQDAVISGIGGETEDNQKETEKKSEASPTVSTTNLLKSKSPSLNTLRKKVQASFRNKRSGSEAEKYASSHRRSKSNDPTCPTCRELTTRIVTLRDDLTTVEDELCASKEVTEILQKQLEVLVVERDTLMKVCQSSCTQTQIDLLRERELEIVNLGRELNKAKKGIELQAIQIEKLESSMKSNQEKISVYQELMHEKDKVVVSLTNEIFDLETEKKSHDDSLNSNDVFTVDQQQCDNFTSFINRNSVGYEETEGLKDALHAFEVQNKFLNKEILELNQLRRDGEERERSLMLCCSEWEARCYQTQSKLLFLLKELDKPCLDGDNKIQDVVSRLLEEAMDETNAATHPIFTPSWSREKDYDELGFSWKWGKGSDLLSTKANNLKNKSEGITSRMKDPEFLSWKVKWDNFMANLGHRALHPTLEFKHLVRGGVPREHRGRIWKGCVDLRVKHLRAKVGENYYENVLLASSDVSRFDPAIKQIELDLLRTLPNNRHYETLDSYGIPQLRRVLLAYSRHNPSVGYCQGLNRLAAIALLFMEEEDAFWLLVAITEFIMPVDYYSKTLIASQVDQRVLKDLMSEKFPRLHNHLEQHNVDLSLYSFTWFLTVYVDNIPPETYLRIWDIFLYEGSKVLFRFALAFFKMCEYELLQLTDYMAINTFLRSISESMTDIKRLTQIAFGDLNPFPMRVITSKRGHYLQLVQSQLDELDAIRKSAETQIGQHRSKDDYYPSDDD